MAKSSLLLTLTLIIYSALSIKATSPPGTCTATANNEPESNNLVPERREVYGGGRIFDISHQYTANMPSGVSTEGLGQFLWLTKSMKNGSKANFSEMKMPTHTGTHVDSPGHVFDHYFDVGFDVDTLDLEVLNDVKNKWDNNSWGRKLIVQKKRASLNDFDRFKIMLAKIKRGAAIKQELAKLKKEAA